MRAWTLLAVATIIVAAVPPATGQDSIRLLRTARVEPGRPVLLDDVAAIEGPQQARLGAIVVAAEPAAEPADGAGWFSVDLGRVQGLLEAELGPKAGMVALSGSACSVRVVLPSAVRAGIEPAPEPIPEAGDVSALVGVATVRGALARELCRILAAAPDALRLGFQENDAELLDRPIEGRVLEISPAGASSRMPVSITVHEPSGRMERRTVRVEVEVRRTVAIVARLVERGRPIAPEDVAPEERWLAPGSPSISPSEAVGAVARRRIKPGELLERQSVEPPVAIERGDRVWVRVVTRGLIVRREGHAAEDGRDGEEIEFTAVDDPRQRFRAVVTGRGDAAVWSEPGVGPGTGLAISVNRD